ncbi:MAG: hypothetical protein IJ662_06635 [Clostridia bacterium]|nr:hypothetical protein [Clostridia bacterium]
MIRVEILEQNRVALRPFVMLPFSLYREDANWVPPLVVRQLKELSEKGNDPRRFFLVYDGQVPVARVMAGINERLNERLNRHCGYLALFECAQRPDYARAVLDAACAYLREEGMDMVIGPATSGENAFSRGMLYDGYDGTPVFMNPYNPPYYNEYFEKCGFRKHRDFFAYFMRMDEYDPKLEEIVHRAKQRFGFRVEHVNLTPENEERVAQNIARVIREAFPPEWEMNVPTYGEVLREIKAMKKYYRPEMTVMAYAGNRPIGLVAVFPDYNLALKKMKGHVLPIGWLKYLLSKGKTHGARCSMQFVVPEYQYRGVNLAMFHEAYLGAKQLGVQWVEGSVIDETSISSITNTEKMASHLYRVYREYEKKLDEPEAAEEN